MTKPTDIERLQAEVESLRATISVLMDRSEADQSRPIVGGDVRDVADLSLRQGSHERQIEARRASARFRALYEASPDALLEVSLGGRVMRTNRTAYTLFCESSKAPVGVFLYELFDAKHSSNVRALTAVGLLSGIELSTSLLDGRLVSLKSSVVNLSDDTHFFVSVRENSGSLALQKSAAKAERMQTLSSFAAALAREYNDPMSIIIGRLELILEVFGETLDATVDRHLRVAFERALQLSASLRKLRLVGVTRLVSVNRIFPREIVDEALEQVQLRSTDLQCEIDLSHDFVVGGDANSCLQILVNVMECLATAASPSGAVNVSGRFVDGQPQLELVAVKEPSEMPYALRTSIDSLRDERADRVGNAQGLDYELGMYIATVIAESMGGLLSVFESSSAVWVILTMAKPPAVPPVRIRGVRRVLLVVGSLRFQRELPSGFRQYGVELIEAGSSGEAMDVINDDERIDAILLDDVLDSGGVSGESLARVLSATGSRFEGRVAVVDPNVSVDGLSTRNAVRLFPKPLSITPVVDWIMGLSEMR